MTRRPLALLALAAALVAGCSSAPATQQAGDQPPTTTAPTASSTTTSSTTAPATASCREAPTGDLERTLDVGGDARTYLVHVPPTLDPGPVPLVVTIHGLGASAQAQLAISGFADLADREGFIVIAPEARGTPAAWDIRTPASDPTSDAAYLRAVLADATATWCIDPARTFASGISNGSAVTFALACSGDLGFAAYAGVAGAFFNEACETAPKASILYFHGTADPIVPIDGGRALGAPVAPAADSLAAWADHNGCGPPSTTAPAASLEETRWTEGCGDAEIRFVRVDGGGHTWPGSSVASPRGFGPTSTAIDATAEMWAFFVAHPRA